MAIANAPTGVESAKQRSARAIGMMTVVAEPASVPGPDPRMSSGAVRCSCGRQRPRSWPPADVLPGDSSLPPAEPRAPRSSPCSVAGSGPRSRYDEGQDPARGEHHHHERKQQGPGSRPSSGFTAADGPTTATKRRWSVSTVSAWETSSRGGVRRRGPPNSSEAGDFATVRRWPNSLYAIGELVGALVRLQGDESDDDRAHHRRPHRRCLPVRRLGMHRIDPAGCIACSDADLDHCAVRRVNDPGLLRPGQAVVPVSMRTSGLGTARMQPR